MKGRELDAKTLDPVGEPVNLLTGNPSEYGWERPGDYNELNAAPWIEAPWMTKHNNIYYLQYSAPGTEYKSYADGYYTSESPLGPFTYASSNPFSSKPEGFIAGAGHGATFQDKHGNWWHIATMSVSVKEKFERRLGLFPVQFDKDGVMMADTKFGDYPTIMPDHKLEDINELSTGWMLLSYDDNKIEASSTLEEHSKENAFNENVRNYWSAKTGDKGEWLSTDLGGVFTINALQINFAENNTQLFGREGVLAHQYLVEYSDDKKIWETLIDQRNNSEDFTHQYHVMDSPIKARYLKVTNYRVPDGTFAISGFRVFGIGNGEKPDQVKSIEIEKDRNDSRNISLSWDEKPGATGYNIRFGISPDKLYRSYKVYKDTQITIRSLNKNQRYWFAIDAFGKNGVTPGVVKSM
ncbi:MAG: family 43 glycosylhydrolase [Sphingobacterium sp.]